MIKLLVLFIINAKHTYITPNNKSVIFTFSNYNTMHSIKYNLKKDCNLEPTKPGVELIECGNYGIGMGTCNRGYLFEVDYSTISTDSSCFDKDYKITLCAWDSIQSHSCDWYIWTDPIIITIFSLFLLIIFLIILSTVIIKCCKKRCAWDSIQSELLL